MYACIYVCMYILYMKEEAKRISALCSPTVQTSVKHSISHNAFFCFIWHTCVGVLKFMCGERRKCNIEH